MQIKAFIVLGLALCIFNAYSQAPGGDFIPFYSGFQGGEFKDLDGWIATGAASPNLITSCGRSNSVVGGAYAFGKGASLSKTFKLPAHYQVRMQVQLWKMKNWDNKRMIALIDGYEWATLWGQQDGTRNICGGANGTDIAYNITFDNPHEQAALSVIFTSTLQGKAWDQSWGVRNIVLSYKPCPVECGTCSGPDPTKCQMWAPQNWGWFDLSGPEGWSVNAGKLVPTVCSGVPFLGGFNNLGSKADLTQIFQNLVPHYKLKISFQFWKIGLWEGEAAQLFVDRRVGWSQNFQYSDGVMLCQTSNDGTPEKIVNVNQEILHTFNAVNLKLTTTLTKDSTVQSWGVRQFYLYVARCAENCAECQGPLASDCIQCASPYVSINGVCKDNGNWILLLKDLNQNITALDSWIITGSVLPSTPASAPVAALGAAALGAAAPAVVAVNNVVTIVSDCAGTKLLGGPDRFGLKAAISRTFTKIPAHKRIRILVEVWKFDAWDGENIFIKLDGLQVWSQTFSWNDPGSQDFCGRNNTIWPQKRLTAEVIIGHQDDSIKFDISSTLTKDAKIQSWAIRDFQIWYEAPDQCATLYTECNFQGKSFTICDGVPNFQLQQYPNLIKSIQIPKDFILVLFDETEYKGQKVTYTKNEQCISNMKFSLAQLLLKVETDADPDPASEVPEDQPQVWLQMRDGTDADPNTDPEGLEAQVLAQLKDDDTDADPNPAPENDNEQTISHNVQY